MTPEQPNQIFELTRRKFEAEFAAMEDEARLKQKLMVNESNAHVALPTVSVAVVTATATTAIKSQKRLLITEEDNITGKISLKIMNIIFCFVNLS